MAKKTTKAGSASSTSHRFLDVPLSAQNKEDLSGYDIELEFPFSLVEALVGEGYKYSLSFDSRNSSYISSLTDRSDQSSWKNTTLSGRGSTPLNSRAALLYRHLVMADGDWSNLSTSENAPAPDFD